ncbi:hypothetical protein GF340_02225 [Candidatus Peregrinibacteria bacterium]|nr:hypothetical protein [Candidatus Peregrinibacteria bacterium]
MDFDLSQRRKSKLIYPRKKLLSREVKSGISLLLGTLLLMIILLSIVFLMNTTASSQKGYSLQQEQQKKDELLIEKRTLDQQINQAMSFEKIETSEIVGEMVKPENTMYVELKN